MPLGNVSASELRRHLLELYKKCTANGRRLNEGAARVLRKLEERAGTSGLHRTYVKSGRSVTMWDVISDTELAQRGYVETRHNSYTIWMEDSVKRDRITCWMSETEAADELWVGQRLNA